ncbi:SGNH/GDSL hydrolase family protein [Pseudopedobacter beijingensis]|uniref:Carbohydrate esterase 2 N-terminal domain-containing protein n=1 Tax=Pseudopedobacter beijingensis TaxID=1207056 RepID=A0ABW4ICE8_9SPHI
MNLKKKLFLLSVLIFLCKLSGFTQTTVDYTDSRILYEGRVDLTETNGLGVYWPGTSIKSRFIGTGIEAELEIPAGADNYYYIILDNIVQAQKLVVSGSKKYYTLAQGLSNTEHTIELVRLNGFHEGYPRFHTKFHNLKLTGTGTFLPVVQTKTRKIEFYGNSITVGYSNEYHNPNNPAEDHAHSKYENNYLGFAARTARYFNAQYSAIAKGGIGLMVSTTDTKMPLLYNKIDPYDNNRTWDFNNYQPDIVVVNLLNNDASIINNPSGNSYYSSSFPSGPPTDEFIINAYKNFISTLRQKYPNTNIICALGGSSVNPNQNNRWKNYVTSAANQLNDNKIFVHFFEYIGRGGHPKALDNETMANSLICFIKCNNLWDAPANTNQNSTTGIDLPLSSEMIYSKNVQLADNVVMQGFDIDANNNVFYSHIAGKYMVKISKGLPNSTPESLMTLRYFGHSTNMAVEKQANDHYVWIGNYGTKYVDGNYWAEQVVSRIKYAPGATYRNHEAVENYYIGPYKHLNPTIDFENNILAISYSSERPNKNSFVLYKLDEVKSLAISSVTLQQLTYGGSGGDAEVTVSPTIPVRDLRQLTPIAAFDVNLTPLDWQGFDISNGKLYYYEGKGGANNGAPGEAYVTIFDFNGQIVERRTQVQAIASVPALQQQGITSTGYMEAEGIKVRNGHLYLGFASREGDIRAANIFRYQPVIQ